MSAGADTYDVAVVGAGPAGLAAAAITAGAELTTLLLDENPTPGGQIYRAITTTPLKERSLLGGDYWAGAALVAETKASGAEIVQGATVWSLDATRELAASWAGTSRFIKARRVILATGALERPFPIPGWTLPGVMTAGALQTLLKCSGLVPDGRLVLAGTGPLLWLLAAQLLRAGARIEALLDTAPSANYLRALPHVPAFALSRYLARGVALRREVARRVEVVRGVTGLRAEGQGALATIAFKTGSGERRLAADVLALHQGVVPNVNLAMAAGIAHRWHPVQLCWVPVLDATGNSGIDGIALAGDGAGIGGALAAEAQGRLAGWAAVAAVAPERLARLPDRQLLEQALARSVRGRAFLDQLFAPPRWSRLPEGDTIVCRCEEVTAAQLLEAVGMGAMGPNQAKAFLRCGMGPCQGRLCGLTVTELISKTRGVAPAEVGHFRLRPPVKPITLAELAAMAHTQRAVAAVVRE
ncbi:MAG TPA: NAD(P)/FAD-dependent oxidoreductase [Hyphomicrobiaceae bacterium]|nr:NAD(P)/FAD-dependent oxidoreductase [Hyphomicrobiaceae bacterium]